MNTSMSMPSTKGMKVQRRDFLKYSAMGLGGLMMGSASWCAAAGEVGAGTSSGAAVAAGKSLDAFEKVPLGKTSVRMSRLIMGTGVQAWHRESKQTRTGAGNFQALLRGAYDRGVRTFDMADLYGSHQHVAKAMEGVPRDSYSLVSKIWWREDGINEPERPDADVVVARFLKETKSDYLDLVLLHCVESPNWPRELRRQMDILAGLKEKGIIRAHGVSCHSLPALEAAVGEPWVDSVHTRINPYGTKMDGPPEKVAPVLQRLSKAGKGVVGMKLIGEGAFSKSEDKIDESIKYVTNLNCLSVYLVGIEKLAEIDDFAVRLKRVSRA